MAAPGNMNEFLDLVRKSGVVDEKRLDAHIQKLKDAGLLPPEPKKIAGVLIRDGLLTDFQAKNILEGKWKRFKIGKYRVLERIGSGGMGQVYLCEHMLMRRRVAIKVLPTAKAADEEGSALERFYREAKVVAQLDHPNIVHAYDIDMDETSRPPLHFLVMEYVDGANLQEIIKKTGPMDIGRACHYIRHAAIALDHAHEQAHIVHRDVKPGNILVDRAGVVKILDMGLARLVNDEDDVLTKKFDENVLGTADYLAPEQALDSHAVDIRADIYSLGATFYFILTGQTPFGEGTVAQKLIWHQTRLPKPLADHRRDIPPGLQEIMNKMMAKEPEQRYSVPGQVAEALIPFTQTPIGPPPETEMPRLSLAATGNSPQDGGSSQSGSKLTSGQRTIKPGSPAFGSPALRTASAIMAASPTLPTIQNPARPAAVKAGATPLPPNKTLEAKEPIATLTPTGTAEEDKTPWENLAVDTKNHAASKDDTPPQSTRVRPGAAGEESAKRKETQRLWTVVIILSVLLLGTVTALLLKFASVPAVDPRPHRAPLNVSRDGTKGFRSIKQALRAAHPGDVIEIHGTVHEENLTVDESGLDVTLQAAPGTEVRWLADPKRKDEKTPLIHIAKAPGFRLRGKGITLDGTIDENTKVRDLILVTLSSPGLTIEDLQFVNVGQNAVKIMNAQGTAEQPIRLLNLAVPQKDAVAVAFDANPDIAPAINDFVEIDGLRGLATPFKDRDSALVGANVKRP